MKPTTAQIVAAVADAFQMRPQYVTSRANVQPIARARLVAYMLARETGASFPAIGRRFNRDHSTIMAGITSIQAVIASDRALAATVDSIRAKLGGIQ